MKRITKTALFLSLLMLTTACSDDFINNTPYTEVVEQNFYKTPQDGFKGLVAVYDILQREGYGGHLLSTEIASDDCYGGFGTSDNNVSLDWDRFTFSTNKEMNAPIWQNSYIGIYRANVLLENLDRIDWGNQPQLKTQYEAEARFLRGYYHFLLARVFGDIVPLDHTITSKEFESPREPAEKTYKLIAEDFKFAADHLGTQNYSTPGNPDYGRITKWAAEALVAKAFLFYTNYYQKPDLAGVVSKAEATNYINDAVKNSGHNLVPNYASLWLASSKSENVPYAGEGNTEIVFAIRLNSSGNSDWDLNEGNRFNANVSTRGGDLGVYGQGWGGATVTASLYNAYGNGDSRRKATIIDYKEEGLNFDPVERGQRQYTGYAWKKGCRVVDPTFTGDFQIDNQEDITILRFSDVLLLAAELNVDSDAAFAQTCLNRVRERAYGDSNHNVTANIANILKERRLELALEGERWFDLIRQGMNATKSAIDATDMGGEFVQSFRTETQGWFGIPQSQVLLSNGAISQNPGW